MDAIIETLKNSNRQTRNGGKHNDNNIVDSLNQIIEWLQIKIILEIRINVFFCIFCNMAVDNSLYFFHTCT